jgi:hypothetical protein
MTPPQVFGMRLRKADLPTALVSSLRILNLFSWRSFSCRRQTNLLSEFSSKLSQAAGGTRDVQGYAYKRVDWCHPGDPLFSYCRLVKSLSHYEQMGWLAGAVGSERTSN